MLLGRSRVGKGSIAVISHFDSPAPILPSASFHFSFEASELEIQQSLGDVGFPSDLTIVVDFFIRVVAWTPSQHVIGEPAGRYDFHSPFCEHVLE